MPAASSCMSCICLPASCSMHCIMSQPGHLEGMYWALHTAHCQIQKFWTLYKGEDDIHNSVVGSYALSIVTVNTGNWKVQRSEADDVLVSSTERC